MCDSNVAFFIGEHNYNVNFCHQGAKAQKSTNQARLQVTIVLMMNIWMQTAAITNIVAHYLHLSRSNNHVKFLPPRR